MLPQREEFSLNVANNNHCGVRVGIVFEPSFALPRSCKELPSHRPFFAGSLRLAEYALVDKKFADQFRRKSI